MGETFLIIKHPEAATGKNILSTLFGGLYRRMFQKL